GTVSCVLNDAHGAKFIPQRTKDRVFALASELKYQPNFFARSLRKKRSYTIGVIVRDIGNRYTAQVIAGIEQFLGIRGYFFILGVHEGNPHLLQKRANAMLQRGIEGLIIVDHAPPNSLLVPVIVLTLPQADEAANFRNSTEALDTSDARQQFQSLGE